MVRNYFLRCRNNSWWLFLLLLSVLNLYRIFFLFYFFYYWLHLVFVLDWSPNNDSIHEQLARDDHQGEHGQPHPQGHCQADCQPPTLQPWDDRSVSHRKHRWWKVVFEKQQTRIFEKHFRSFVLRQHRHIIHMLLGAPSKLLLGRFKTEILNLLPPPPQKKKYSYFWKSSPHFIILFCCCLSWFEIVFIYFMNGLRLKTHI